MRTSQQSSDTGARGGTRALLDCGFTRTEHKTNPYMKEGQKLVYGAQRFRIGGKRTLADLMGVRKKS